MTNSFFSLWKIELSVYISGQPPLRLPSNVGFRHYGGVFYTWLTSRLVSSQYKNSVVSSYLKKKKKKIHLPVWEQSSITIVYAFSKIQTKVIDYWGFFFYKLDFLREAIFKDIMWFIVTCTSNHSKSERNYSNNKTDVNVFNSWRNSQYCHIKVKLNIRFS